MPLSTRTVYIIVLVLSIIVMLLALGLAATAGFVLSLLYVLREVLDPHFFSAPIIFFVSCTLQCVGTLVGVCGAMQRSTGHLIASIALNTTGSVLQAAGGLVAFLVRDKDNVFDVFTMQFWFRHYEAFAQQVDAIQRRFQCCGFEEMPRLIGFFCEQMPPSCCSFGGDGRSCTSCSSSRFRDGCADAVIHFLEQQSVLLFTMAVATTPIQIALIHCLLCLNFRYENLTATSSPNAQDAAVVEYGNERGDSQDA